MKSQDAIFYAVLIRSKDRFLICRVLNGDRGVPGNYHFPGGSAKGEKGIFSQVKATIKAKYGADIAPFAKLSASSFLLGDGSVQTIVPIFAKEVTPLRFTPDLVSSRFAGIDEIDSLPFDYGDRFLFRKGEAYYDVLTSGQRRTPLSVADAQKVLSMEESIRYFGKRIPKERVKEFRLCLVAEVPYSKILECYLMMLEESKLDYNEYLSFVRAKRASYAE